MVKYDCDPIKCLVIDKNGTKQIAVNGDIKHPLILVTHIMNMIICEVPLPNVINKVDGGFSNNDEAEYIDAPSIMQGFISIADAIEITDREDNFPHTYEIKFYMKPQK